MAGSPLALENLVEAALVACLDSRNFGRQLILAKYSFGTSLFQKHSRWQQHYIN